MRALWLGADGLSVRTGHPPPRPGPGEALIRVRLAGVCATDLELVKGYAGFEGIPGHEFVGEVEETSSPEWRGRRVVGAINVGCGTCRVCAGSGPEHCPRRTVLGIVGRDGAFAEYLTLPEANLLAVPESLADEAAVFTEPLAAALRVRDQVAVPPSARMAVVGPGRLGLLVAQVLALDGGRVEVLGRGTESLELPARMGLVTGLAAEAGDDAYDLVVEATGNEAGLATALRLLRPRGTLVLKSTYAGEARVDLTKLVVGELTVLGSRCGPFAPAVRLLAGGRIETAPLVEGEYPLARGLEAIRQAGRPGVRKVLLRP